MCLCCWKVELFIRWELATFHCWEPGVNSSLLKKGGVDSSLLEEGGVDSSLLEKGGVHSSLLQYCETCVKCELFCWWE